ncbi:hypothetical protein HAX54_020277, partial [Datura stramonium]|nr:hypothetical protein [Datura stramonium]
MVAQQVTRKTKDHPPQAIRDEEELGSEMEEDVLRKTFARLFLNNEGLQEVFQ